ncbi:hypothetical protein [Acetobacter pasteurianus]|uniref:Uncharacterized protein n=2 Tax=Acetobacter pasteurianus TaxID=438 RepID=C7JGA5_ACEP3|nr:hypothetical protein [Acetobacter pasteurianus]ASC05751.1 hypothetical protein S101468_01497 [Acetobacter pasteurianus subsp. pasteurianus]BAI00675.1 hypothetical protein APA01_25770 [Acetobacter pasteurianus IFO 3283-01]BAI03724.1 hypothetical protein APA03_25770 [Acetobacter pasteurianus IFO 3283-03]BAI06771.1 hypothetical protein APA07_25770 [Acetobacter pasteurianus IFO 3283-07]BAI09819.1 hypothetical protein APA22_25770 [Acetobacter pasteurianus IFO 3283-22]
MLNECKGYIKNHPGISVVVVVLISVFIDRIIMCFSVNDLLKVIPSTIIGLMTLYIAFQQHVISRRQKEISERKLKLDIFEKRYDLYKEYSHLIIKVSYDIKVKTLNEVMDDSDRLLPMCCEGGFLFGSKCREEMFSILEKINDGLAIKESIEEKISNKGKNEDEKADAEIKKLWKECEGIFEGVIKDLAKSEETFEKYLDLTKIETF